MIKKTLYVFVTTLLFTSLSCAEQGSIGTSVKKTKEAAAETADVFTKTTAQASEKVESVVEKAKADSSDEEKEILASILEGDDEAKEEIAVKNDSQESKEDFATKKVAEQAKSKTEDKEEYNDEAQLDETIKELEAQELEEQQAEAIAKAAEKVKGTVEENTEADVNAEVAATAIEEKEVIQEASFVESQIKDGFYNFSYDCSMRESSSMDSRIVGIIRKGKRLWVDKAQGEWATVYRTSGPAYVKRGCL